MIRPVTRSATEPVKPYPVVHAKPYADTHLTVVFAALAISRDLQARTAVTIKKLVQTLRTARSATIEINGQRMTLEPKIDGPATAILNRLETGH